MSKEICISSTPHETRLAIVEDEQLTEVYYERENEYTLAGSIYKGRVTRVLPGMQSAFVDVGLERDAFLYVTDFLEEQEDSAEFERVPANGRPEERDQAGRQQPGQQPQDRHQQGRDQLDRETRESSNSPGAASSPEDGSAPVPAEEFEEGTRRWRGRRGRRNRGFRPQAAPRGVPAEPQNEPRSEPSATVEPAYRGADRDDEEVAFRPPPAVAFSLPGESLSKYGGRTAAKETAPAGEVRGSQQRTNFTPSKPSTLIEEPLRWSGAGLLPGESLSRYRGATEAATEPSGTQQAAPAASPVADPIADPVLSGVAPSAAEPEHLAAHSEIEHPNAASPEYEAEPLAPPPSSAAAPPAALGEQAVVEESEEFEPQEASASYRVDPSAPSEFRVAASPQIPVEAEPVEAVATAIPAPELEHDPLQPHGEDAISPGVKGSAFAPPGENEDDAGEDFEDLDPELHDSDSSTGLLEEEEVSEEEEWDSTPLYSNAEDQELEEMEEETLDPRTADGDEIDEMMRDARLEQGIDPDVSGLTIDEADEGEEDQIDDEPEDGELGTENEGTPAVSTAGQLARRERQEQRRGGRGNRHDGRRRHNGRRQSAQTSDLPIISELLKQGQEILVQIAKEPIAKKGARITSHIALPGRFLVFMPTVNHVGVSRKISSDEERQRLKRILISEKGTGAGGFIVRTAADGASEDDLRADIRFLISLWTEIKQRADEAKAPALIYHDLNLVERILRDQVSDNFSTIWVDNEVEYERIVRFLNRFQPSLVRRVKLYTKETPLFEQFGIQEEIGKALKSKVWLKSGGSIVINQTEALVAIDINTGKYVGKTARLEDTILKTNLDAIPEIVRQIRLRDLGGIIVIDFIDMDERKNRHKVMQALEEALQSDRAPSKVLQFNDFGLVAITRKRVKQSLERTLCVQCSICAGTGMTKSPATVCNEIYVEMRKMQRHLDRQDVLLRVHPEVVKVLKANNARWLSELEEMTGKTIIVKSDPALPPEQFDIH